MIRTTLRRAHCTTALAALALPIVAACSSPQETPATSAAPAVKSAEARIQMYKDCWSQFNNKEWDKFSQCYTENAVSEAVDSNPPSVSGRTAIIDRAKQDAESFPDRKGELKLILSNGQKILGIALYTATNTGPLPPGPDGKPVPATNKKVGFYMGHSVDFDTTGSHAMRDAGYLEEATMMAQLGAVPRPARPVAAPTGAAPTEVIARDDEKEKSNVATVQSLFEAANTHDIQAMGNLMADNYTLIEIGQPKDLDKKESLASTKEFMSAFPDLAMTPSWTWAAGDYVVVEGSIAGTNKGAMPSMGLAKATGKPFKGRFLEVMKVVNGKIQEDWLFYNGMAFAAQLGMQ